MKNKTYSGAGSQYYDLTMSGDGNIDFSLGSQYSAISIYDRNMTLLFEYKGGWNFSQYLIKGNYIVKFRITSYQNNSLKEYITVYSPSIL